MNAVSYKMRFGTKHLTPPQFCVLMNLVFHSNVRNRAWPAISTIASETGLGTTSVSNAIQRLIEIKAIEKVAYDKRVGKEAELYQSKNVYQLTGVFVIESEVFEYFHVDDSIKDRINFTRGKNLPDKNLPDVDEVYTSNTSIDKKEEVNTDAPPCGASSGYAASFSQVTNVQGLSEEKKQLHYEIAELIAKERATNFETLDDKAKGRAIGFALGLWKRELKGIHEGDPIALDEFEKYLEDRRRVTNGATFPTRDGKLSDSFLQWRAAGQKPPKSWLDLMKDKKPKPAHGRGNMESAPPRPQTIHTVEPTNDFIAEALAFQRQQQEKQKGD